MTTQTKDNLVRLRLLTHNARLVATRKEKGINAEEVVYLTNIKRCRLRDIENLRSTPTDDEMCRIASILGKPIDFLFPEALLSATRVGVFSHRKAELGARQLIALTKAQMSHLLITDGGIDAVEDKVDKELLAGEIHKAVKLLNPREQLVIGLRFGFDGKGAKTLEQVGQQFNVTRERIRHIEAQALRKLRHPSRGRKLKEYLV